MTKPVGYLVKHPGGLEGERGLYYDYVLASNGLFIEAEGKLMAARVPVTLCEVRGLAPLEPKVALRYGRIPQRFFDLTLSAFLADTSKERYVAVTWNDGYHLYVPEQDAHGARVEYLMGDSVLLDFHSHGTMEAGFSSKDNEDEKGFKLYGVVGKLGATPQVILRVGVYGYRNTIAWGDVFDGCLNGAVEIGDELLEELEELKEDIEHELHGDPAGSDEGLQNRSSWLRWDRWFRRRRAVPAPPQ